jgi:hypothetical protein
MIMSIKVAISWARNSRLSQSSVHDSFLFPISENYLFRCHLSLFGANGRSDESCQLNSLPPNSIKDWTGSFLRSYHTLISDDVFGCRKGEKERKARFKSVYLGARERERISV